MIIYQKKWRVNHDIVNESKKWYHGNLILQKQYEAIINHFQQDFRSSNLFIRIALFIFTCLCVSAFIGLFFLLFDVKENHQLYLLFYGLILLVILEKIVKAKHLHKSGIDEALVVSSCFCLLVGFESFLPDKRPIVANFLLSFPVLLIFMARWANLIIAVGLNFCGFMILWLLLTNEGKSNHLIVPFAVMAFSLFVYYLSKKLNEKNTFEAWDYSLTFFKISGLSALYLGGNYLIVRAYFEISDIYEDMPGQDIPLAAFFYLLTSIVPLIYLGLGVKLKNAIFLRVGILALAFSLFTFKYHFIEGYNKLILTVVGALLIISAKFLSQYFTAPKHGFTIGHLFRKDTLIPELDLDEIVISNVVQGTPLKDAKERLH